MPDPTVPETRPASRREAPFEDSWQLPSAPVVLEDDGFRFQIHPGRRPSPPVAYGAITHLAVTKRGLWLATRHSTALLRRRHFRDADGPERLAQELVRRISQQPGGMAQLARFAQIERMARDSRRRFGGYAVVLLCALLYTLQLVDPFVEEVGAFVPDLVKQGQFWRVATAHFLHDVVPLHLHFALNAICLLGLSILVERPLGTVPTLLVMGTSGLSAMVASAAAGDHYGIGASGMAAGLAGAALCLELRHPDRLPGAWRLPRRFFITALLINAALGLVVPAIAGAAHLGGFAAGYLVTRLVAGEALVRRPARPAVVAAVAVLALGLALSLSAARQLVMRDATALNAYALDLLGLDEVWPTHFNDVAWRIGTESEASREQLETAVVLAELAVAETERSNPDHLDTLAELLFSLGDREGAIATIDEAIGLSGGERYFREQRRRFRGERRAEDRPDPPAIPWPERELPDPEDSLSPGPDEGIAI